MLTRLLCALTPDSIYSTQGQLCEASNLSCLKLLFRSLGLSAFLFGLFYLLVFRLSLRLYLPRLFVFSLPLSRLFFLLYIFFFGNLSFTLFSVYLGLCVYVSFSPSVPPLSLHSSLYLILTHKINTRKEMRAGYEILITIGK